MADRTIRTVLTLDPSQYESGMQRAKRATEGLGTAAKETGTVSASAMQRMAQSARTQQQQWTQVGGALTAAGAATTGLMTAVLSTGVSYNTLRQQSLAALTTLTGSAEAAAAQMDRLDDFASNSPFARDVFIRAQQQMLGFGIEAQKVVPYLDAIQNAVAAAGGSNHDIAELARIFSQVSATAKITATDLREFGNRGVDAATLIGSQMGMTGAEIRESITAGTLDAQAALDALAAGMATTYEGAADGVKDTFLGAVDRVKAAFRDLSSTIAEPLVGREGGGLLTGALNQLADFMRAVERLPAPVLQIGGALTGLAGLAATAAGGFMLLAPRIVSTVDAMRELGIRVPDVRGKLGRLDLRGFAQRASLAAAAITAMSIAMRGLSSTSEASAGGVEEVRRHLIDLGEVGADITTLFQDIELGWLHRPLFGDNSVVRDLADFETQLRRMTDEGLLEKAERGLGSFFGAWDDSLQGQFEARMGQVNDILSELVTSGDLETAAELFNNLSMAAGGTDQAALQLINSMPEFRDALIGVATEAGLATDDATLLKIALGFVAAESEEAAVAVHGFEGVLQGYADAQEAANDQLRDWRDMVADAVTSFGGLVDGYNAAAEAADEGVVSLDAWIEALEDQAEAAANWRENVLTATEQIKEQVPADMQAAAHAMVDEFIAAGPEGAAALALFTEASAEEKLRILEAWQGTGYELAGTFAEEVESARKPEVGASTVPAEEALGALLGAIAASEEEVVIDGHAVPADEVLSALRHRIATSNEDVTIDGNEAPALDVLNALVLAIANEEEDVTINGNRVPADQVVGELMRWIGDQNEAVDVHANTAPATADVRNWSPPNKTIAMGADLTAARREVLSWRPSVQIAMYGQAAMASGGYVGDFARAARFASGGFARRFDAGGSVFGPGTGTSDSIPAWLSNGEFVQKAAAVQKYGLAFMHAVNQGRYPAQLARGYADGGYASQRFTPSVQYVPRVAPAGGGRGLRIRGRLDLGNGLEGFIDGRIDERDWLEAYS